MPITGLLLTLADAPDDAAHALALLGARPEITLGPRRGRRLAAAAETADLAADRLLFEWLHSRPEVLAVDVVWAWLDQDEPAGATEPDTTSLPRSVAR